MSTTFYLTEFIQEWGNVSLYAKRMETSGYVSNPFHVRKQEISFYIFGKQMFPDILKEVSSLQSVDFLFQPEW